MRIDYAHYFAVSLGSSPPDRSPMMPATQRAKRATNISLNDPLITEAKALGINLSQAAETGISQAIKKKKEELWLLENRAALDGWNEYVEKHGLPLAKYRQF